MSEEAGEITRHEIVYSLDRAAWLGGWWTWAIAVALLGVILYAVYRLYRRDTSELSRPVRATLILLRIGVVVGLVFFLLGLERRARQRITRPSEVAVLIDTSQSMSLPHGDAPGGPSRIERIAQLVDHTPWLTGLGENNRVTAYTFDASGELNEVVVSSLTADAEQAADSAAAAGRQAEGGVAATSPLAIAGAVVLVAAVLAMLAAAVLQLTGRSRRARVTGPLDASASGDGAGGGAGESVLLASAVLMVAGGVMFGSAWTRHADRSLASLFGWAEVATDQDGSAEDADRDEAEEPSFEEKLEAVDWDSVLVAAGSESRIGDAIRSTLTRHDPSTLAGIVLLSDGQNNAGTPPASAAALVARGGTAIYPIGFGSSRPPVNVRLVDLEAPRRVYPGDSFALSAVLQGSGSQPMDVQVQLLDVADSGDDAASDAEAASAEAPPAVAADAEVVDTRQVTVPADGTLTGVRFEMSPESVGRRRLTVRVVPPAGDQNPRDDLRHARYEVVSRRLRVLLVAGGPMREYRFVRNLLYRDPSVEVDALLQTGQQGMSQDADRLLTEFPSTPNELFEYDAIVAFDPDWMQLDANQINLLDEWLTRQAGGLVLVSGPVYMPEWMRQRTDPRVAQVRNFFPVVLPNRGPLLSGGRSGGDTSWPLEFSPDASRAEFLNLTDDADAAGEVWEQFSGVYDFVGVQDAKPGAKVYARFSDPSTAIGGSLPIYLASQFYGAGRVYFQGSGEMWRLRGVSDAYYDTYYTKLIRWVSEGRLLRDSNRGILLVDRPRAMVGDTISVRAILTDEQFEPLRVPEVQADLLTPSGRIETVRLSPLEGEPREGTYSGRFLAREAGAFEIRLTLGDALEEDVLRQPVQVRLPTLELERPQRNDEVLRSLAATTGGKYLTPDDANASSAGDDDPLELVELIEPQPQIAILPGTRDRDFERRRNASLMWLLSAMLTMEWVVRRLHRLA